TFPSTNLLGTCKFTPLTKSSGMALIGRLTPNTLTALYYFIPCMDVHIHCRRFGTVFRYILWSCDPCVTMRSSITPDNQVHLCFVAKYGILVGSKLTASWDLPAWLFHTDPKYSGSEIPFQDRCDHISRLPANFGDCAYDLL